MSEVLSAKLSPLYANNHRRLVVFTITNLALYPCLFYLISGKMSKKKNFRLTTETTSQFFLFKTQQILNRTERQRSFAVSFYKCISERNHSDERVNSSPGSTPLPNSALQNLPNLKVTFADAARKSRFSSPGKRSISETNR